MTPTDLELMLNFIAKECVKDEITLNRYRSLGVNPIDWPPIRSKSLFIDFLASIEAKSYTAAQRSHGAAFMRLETERYDFEHIKVNYKRELDVVRYRDLATQLLDKPYDGDQILSKFKTLLPTSVELKNVGQELAGVVHRQIQAAKDGNTMVVIPGFEKLSKAIGGFNEGRVTIISAASGFGKTKFAISLADAAKKVMPVIIYNMEMLFDDFVSMFIQKNARIRNTYWQEGSFLTSDNLTELERVVDDPSFGNLKVTDGTSISKPELIGSIYQETTNNPSLIIIDYDQKVISDSSLEEWKAILKLITELEQASMNTKSHVILLAQANETGHVRASVRANQPATCLLNFTRDDEGRTILKSIKNRKGSPFILEVDYDASLSTVIEKDFIVEKPKMKVERQWPKF